MKKHSQSIPSKRRSKPEAAASDERIKVVFNEKEIRRRVRELAKEIDRDYQGKTLHVVGVMEDSFMFVADLVRALTVPVVCSFIRSQVRDSDSGRVALREITYVLPSGAGGEDLLLVEGVLQTGVTLDHLYHTLLAQRPASLRAATLLDRSAERKVDVPVHYVGFKVSGNYLVGYGLSYQDQYRNLPYIARIV